MSLVEEFNSYRSKMNERMSKEDNLVLKRILNLDTRAFEAGALPSKTKELIGLSSSAVLRCDDCIKYHIEAAFKAGASHEEIMETLSIALLIGGTIVIPHLRRALEFLDDIEKK